MTRQEPLDSEQLQAELTQCWTIQDLMQVFGVSAMSIWNWMREENLPAIRIPGARSGRSRGIVRFVPFEVKMWAARTGRRMRRLPRKATQD